MKRFTLKILLLVVSLLCFLFVLELCSRIILEKTDLHHGPVAQGVGNLDVCEYPDFYLKDKTLFWRLEKSVGNINSLGFRDIEFMKQKRPGTIRIICMGDSITYGWPAPLKKTYPRMLETILNKEKLNKKVEVINAGIPGYTSYQGRLWFKKELINYSPDILIVYFGVNDSVAAKIEDKSYKMPPEYIIKTVNFLKRFASYRLYKKAIMHLTYSIKGRKTEYSTVRVTEKDFKKNLEQINVIADKENCDVIVIENAVFYDPITKNIFSRERYRAPPDTDRINIYDIIKRAKADYQEIFVDDCRPHNFHLTEKGQAILAEAIADFLHKKRVLEKRQHE